MGPARFHCATLLTDDVYRNDIKTQLNNMALNNGIFLVSTLFMLIMGSHCMKKKCQIKVLAERGFDPRTSGLWAQHASTAPLCC